MNEYIDKIKAIASGMGEVRIMEVCGGHTNSIMKYGIRGLLPKNIKLISGPGCPVCVTSQSDIDAAIELALNHIPLAAYGDMMHVPGSKMSLRDAQARGADIKTLYSVDQIINDRKRVFFAVGFETTTPMTAKLLSEGITVFSSHKLIPPAMKVLVTEMKIDGFIDPGHVSTIIGEDIWRTLDIPRPQVISGFQPDALLRAIYRLIVLIKEKRVEVINDYEEVVLPKGNMLAQALIKKTMKEYDAEWRGIGVLPKSGLIPRDPKLDARLVFEEIVSKAPAAKDNGCRCGEIVRGMIEPRDCKFFGKECTPERPMGACMVSDSEGACAIAFKYGRSLSE
ncbi:MAG: hydrogenase formation protein HypD [Nanoarchaeota archaeon]|nr:hydrogenase formation protein HypD [Nanoarchaeota archaeon]